MERGDGMDKTTLSYKTNGGREVSRSVNHILDIRELTRTAVYPWLVMAANQHLSNEEIALWLEHVAIEHPAVRRPYSWIKKRRKRTRLPDLIGPRGNRDGNDSRAFAIMAAPAHQTLSLRGLAACLGEQGISRSREWIRSWRSHGY